MVLELILSYGIPISVLVTVTTIILAYLIDPERRRPFTWLVEGPRTRVLM
jgi:hypothetical protein